MYSLVVNISTPTVLNTNMAISGGLPCPQIVSEFTPEGFSEHPRLSSKALSTAYSHKCGWLFYYFLFLPKDYKLHEE